MPPHKPRQSNTTNAITKTITRLQQRRTSQRPTLITTRHIQPKRRPLQPHRRLQPTMQRHQGRFQPFTTQELRTMSQQASRFRRNQLKCITEPMQTKQQFTWVHTHRPQPRPTAPKPQLHQRLLFTPLQPKRPTKEGHRHPHRYHTTKRNIMRQRLILFQNRGPQGNHTTTEIRDTTISPSANMRPTRSLNQGELTKYRQQAQRQNSYLRTINSEFISQRVPRQRSRKHTNRPSK